MRTIRVAVVDEHEIFRRGVVACLQEDPMVEVVWEGSEGAASEQGDVGVVSSTAAVRQVFPWPLVVCSGEPSASPAWAGGNLVLAVLPRSTLTPEQLIGAVRAAAAGLRVDDRPPPSPSVRPFDTRRVEVLRLLARGADTQEISQSLRYSERTIKTLIQEIERDLGARSRAQAVAEGIRLGLI